MTQKELDKMIKEAEWQIEYHEKQLIKAHALLEGLKQITNVEPILITES